MRRWWHNVILGHDFSVVNVVADGEISKVTYCKCGHRWVH